MQICYLFFFLSARVKRNCAGWKSHTFFFPPFVPAHATDISAQLEQNLSLPMPICTKQKKKKMKTRERNRFVLQRNEYVCENTASKENSEVMSRSVVSAMKARQRWSFIVPWDERIFLTPKYGCSCVCMRKADTLRTTEDWVNNN